MSMGELSRIYGEKSLPPIDDTLLDEASACAAANNCSVEEALLYILDMIVERPFGG